MLDQDKSKQELIEELAEMRRREAQSRSVAAERDRDRAILAAAIDCLPFEFFAIGTDGRYMLQNEVSRRHAGDSIGRCPEDCAPDEYTRQLWLDNNRRAFAGERVEGEVEAHVGGETRTYYNIISPIREDGKVCGILGVNVDITERKRAEEALRQAHDELEEKVQERTAELTIFKKFAEASGLGFSMTCLDGRIAYVNSAWLRLVGESQVEDVIGQHISTYCPKEYWERRDTEVIPVILDKGLWQGEFSLVSRDGRSIPAIHSLFPIRDKGGHLVQLGAVVTDITQRKQAEEELRRNHEVLRQTQATLDAFFSASTVILNIVDDQSRYIKTDNLTPTYFGLDSQSIVGKSVKELAPEFVREYGPMLRHVIETGIPLHNVEVKSSVPGRPGEIVYWRASYFPIPLSDGRRGRGTVAVEVTDMKRAEEALRRSEEKYRSVVEACPDAVVMSDLNGQVLFASRQTWKLLGLSDSDELVGRSIFDYVIQNDRKRLAGNMSNLVEAGVRKKHGVHIASSGWNHGSGGNIFGCDPGRRRTTEGCHGRDSATSRNASRRRKLCDQAKNDFESRSRRLRLGW